MATVTDGAASAAGVGWQGTGPPPGAATPATPVAVRTPAMEEVDWTRWNRRRRWTTTALSVATPLVLLGVWQLAASAGWIDQRFYASPLTIWDRSLQLVDDGTLQSHTWITTQRLLTGYAIGSVVGVLVGIVLGSSRILSAILEPTLRALYTVPKLAILPIFLLLFGVGEMPKMAFIATGTFYIVCFSTLDAVRLIPQTYYEVSKSFNVEWPRLFRSVLIPASLPQIVSGLRLASGIAVLLTVAVEFVQADDGLGYLAWHSWQLFQADRMYVGIVCVAILGVSFGGIVAWVGKLATPWMK